WDAHRDRRLLHGRRDPLGPPARARPRDRPRVRHERVRADLLRDDRPTRRLRGELLAPDHAHRPRDSVRRKDRGRPPGVPHLQARTRREAILVLARVIAAHTDVDEQVLAGSAIEREAVLPTELGHEVALPHARVAGLAAPITAIGVAPAGIDWNAPDNLPARI